MDSAFHGQVLRDIRLNAQGKQVTEKAIRPVTIRAVLLFNEPQLGLSAPRLF